MNLRPTPIARAIAAASLVCLAQGALASATFTLTLAGEATHFRDCWEDLTLCPIDGPPLNLEPVKFLWTGTVTVVTSSAADGFYGGADLLSFSLESNLGGFTQPWIFADGKSPSATIAGGEIVSLTAHSETSMPTFTNISGLSATYNQPNSHHYGPTTARGVLTPVPEPETYALLLAGLAAVGFAARRRRA